MIKNIIVLPTFLLTLALPLLGVLLAEPVQASFSGSDCNNYTCPQLGRITSEGQSTQLTIRAPRDPAPGCEGTNIGLQGGNFVCEYSDGQGNIVVKPAIPKPPQLRVLEFWFVRIVYVAWAIAGVFFTFVLIAIGFQYMTSFGNEVALKDVVVKFRNWMIGLALVFLSYPVLNTFFNVLTIDRDQSCYSELQMPGFQFFFPQACGDVVDDYNSCRTSCLAGSEALTPQERETIISRCESSCRSQYLP